MHRENLDFLKPMFQFNDINDFHLLIINQTEKGKELNSDNPKIKVINMFEFGVPKSRILAIQEASKDICLMADDDIIYQPDLYQIISEAYSKHQTASMISFEAIDEDNKLYADYYPEGAHTKASLTKIFTWVISFKRQDYLEKGVSYSPYFGFGAAFEGNEEYVFLRNAFDKGLKMQHVSKTIVFHPFENSGKDMGSDRALYARAAMWQRLNGNLSYFWVFKFVFFLWRHSYITFTQIPEKIKTAFRGIKAYKLLENKS